MTSPRRISVVGSSGSGKTWLARELADQLGLPLWELDQLRLGEDGSALSTADFMTIVSTLAGQNAWIIDGHYRCVRDLIWQRSDTVVWLNYPLPLVAYRLLRRYSLKGPGGAENSDRKVAPSAPLEPTGARTRASARQRFSRLYRTLQERGEYGTLLHSPAYDHVVLYELRSTRAAKEWLRALGQQPTQSACTPDMKITN